MQSIIFMVFMTVVLSFACGLTYGQTFSEWWQQKKTRIKYLKQQAATLEKLRETIEGGNAIVEKGTNKVLKINREEVLMHQKFLESLKLVKPGIKDNPEVVTCRALLENLLWRAMGVMQILNENQGFTEGDIILFKTFVGELTAGLLHDAEELNTLISDGDYTMKDAERYARIHVLSLDIRSMYRVVMSYINQMEEMLIIKQQRANEEFLRAQNSFK